MCSGQITTSPSSRSPSGRAVLVDRERQHVGRPVLAAVLGVELGDPLGVDELDRDVAVLDARRRRPRARTACRTSLGGSAPPITSTSSIGSRGVGAACSPGAARAPARSACSS